MELAPVTQMHSMAMGGKENKALKSSKQLLLSFQLLVHFNPIKKEIILCYDASAYGIGAVLAYWMSNEEDQSIGFVSHTLTAIEKNYSQIEKEALPCIFGISHIFVWP